MAQYVKTKEARAEKIRGCFLKMDPYAPPNNSTTLIIPCLVFSNTVLLIRKIIFSKIPAFFYIGLYHSSIYSESIVIKLNKQNFQPYACQPSKLLEA
jgi:hypothetical protein